MATHPPFTIGSPIEMRSRELGMTDVPKSTTGRPPSAGGSAEGASGTGHSPDVLSDVLRAIRLSGAVFFTVEGYSPWAFDGPASAAVETFLRSGNDHVVPFHAIASGSCWVGVQGEPPVQLHAGDVIVLPQNDRHVVSSEPGLTGPPVEVRLDPAARTPLPLPVHLGSGGGPRCEVICGFLGCDVRPFNPLFDALPRRMLVARGATQGAALGSFIELTREELTRSGPGRETMLARLAEVMFVEALRRFIEAYPTQMGWLAGMSDELVGRSLAALHSRPGDPWTLDVLARHVATSRSVLAERFTGLLGMAPMQYLARWRMQLATELLAGSKASIAEIAHRLGYGSEAALSRAFKRIVGVSPAHWRRGRRPLPPPG
jgi:AraC-like DNA-binding protein